MIIWKAGDYLGTEDRGLKTDETGANNLWIGREPPRSKKYQVRSVCATIKRWRIYIKGFL